MLALMQAAVKGEGVMSNKAVVVGGLGVIGRNLVRHLDGLPDWEIVGLSRREPDFERGALPGPAPRVGGRPQDTR